MTAILDILRFFEAFAPVQTAMDFDNVGLLIGDKNRTVTKAVVSLDITAETVEEAAALGCELIISHHPVIFRPLKHLHTRDAAYLLARHDIAAVCMHTNLDLSDDFGVNLCLAAALGLQNVRKSSCGECLFIGELAEKADMTDFAAHAKAALHCEGLRYTDKKAHVQTVAVASGAGGSEFFAAAEEGADVLVSGEIKHHEILAANSLGLNMLDAGHFKTEDVVILPLAQKLGQTFEDVQFIKSAVSDDGVKYL
ncbi:MAG: Nif3-like dinuclear metal center hexameric protein [Ruminococcus sp.]